MKFVLLIACISLPALAHANSSCRDHIRDIVCIAEPASETDTPETRVCVNAPQYSHFFEDVFDQYPPYLQEIFCHLEKIFIEKDWQGSAYAGVFFSKIDPSRPRSGFIGIRKSLLDSPSSASDWASWKEQLSFGTAADHVNVAQGLPSVVTSLGPQSDMLFFAITHELGHVFDFSNNLNAYDNCSGPYGDLKGSCTAKAGSWTALSWASSRAPLPINEFVLRNRNCSYFCNGRFISANEQNEFYLELAQSSFLTPYASRMPTEDFAETFAFYHLWKLKNGAYSIHTADGSKFDVIAKLLSAQFAAKRKFVEDFLKGPILYPDGK